MLKKSYQILTVILKGSYKYINFIRWTNINVIYPFSTRQRVTRALRTTVSHGHANLPGNSCKKKEFKLNLRQFTYSWATNRLGTLWDIHKHPCEDTFLHVNGRKIHQPGLD